MRRDDLFPSKWLKAADVGEALKVIIREVTLEELGDEREEKPVARFIGNQKGLVLNRTNFNTIAAIAGTDETDEWPGTELTLYAEMIAFRGQTAPAIRVRSVPPVVRSKPAKARPAPGGNIEEDTIPF